MAKCGLMAAWNYDKVHLFEDIIVRRSEDTYKWTSMLIAILNSHPDLTGKDELLAQW